MGRRPVTVRLARWSAEHPWRAIALWVVFVAVCFVGGNAAGLNEATDADQAIGEFGRAELIVDSGDFHDPAIENVLITARSGALDPAAAKAAAAGRRGPVAAGRPGVASVGYAGAVAGRRRRCWCRSPWPATRTPPRTGCSRCCDATAAVQEAHPALRIEEVGGPSIGKALDDTLGKDFRRPSCSACRSRWPS